MQYKDYYKILGLSKKASQDEIKKAHRKLAFKYHPDQNQGNKKAEENFKEISEAYQVLGDPDKRKQYDRLGAQWKKYGQGGFDEFAKQWQQQRGSRVEFEGDFGDIFNNKDFFSSFFGGRAGRGRNFESKISISLEEAYTGLQPILRLEKQRIKIRIKPGIKDGQILKIPGKGGTARGGRGDLLLTINIKKHPVFERKGNDLYAKINIDLYTAILGGKAMVHTLKGKMNVNIPPYAQNDQILKLKGLGMPDYKNPQRFGHLFIILKIVFPTSLSDEERNLFEQLREIKNKINHFTT